PGAPPPVPPPPPPPPPPSPPPSPPPPPPPPPHPLVQTTVPVVVNVSSVPWLLPLALAATSRNLYVVWALRPAVPYSNWHFVTAAPWGLTVPCTVAVVSPRLVAASVATAGVGPVVNVPSSPSPAPPAFFTTSRKW